MAGRLNFMPPLSSLNFERADNGDAAFMALSVSFRDTFKIDAPLVSEFFLAEKYMIKAFQFVIDQLNYEKFNLYLNPKKSKHFSTTSLNIAIGRLGVQRKLLC